MEVEDNDKKRGMNIPVPYLSIVIPVFNEEDNLKPLNSRLIKSLNLLGKSFEIIYIDDGSSDSSWDILKSFNEESKQVRIVQFNRNYGQHTAILSGFELSKGEVVVTLDGDLQTPPENLPVLLKEIEKGHDFVGGWRKNRKDPFFRKIASKLGNKVLSRITGIKLRDYGSMFRAYKRDIINRILEVNEFSSFFIPALAYTHSKKPIEIPISHDPRYKGESKYNIIKLAKLNFDILTSFSLITLQVITIAGLILAGFGFLATMALAIVKLIFDIGNIWLIVISLLIMFLGLQTLFLGFLGEYIGRIYTEVRKRPKYVISKLEE